MLQLKEGIAGRNGVVPARGFAHGLSLTLPRKSHVQGTALHLETSLWHDLAFSDLIRHLTVTYTNLLGEGSLPIQQPLSGLFVGHGPYQGL